MINSYKILNQSLLKQLLIPMDPGKKVTVYCNGVCDLYHVGHINVLKFCRTIGTDVIIGIHSDEVVNSYKRLPVMRSNERYNVVRESGFADEIIEDAPLVTDEKFMKEHNIDIVVCSPEYDLPNDHYYADPRRMGVLRVAPRTEGISTSDLIKLVKANENNAEQELVHLAVYNSVNLTELVKRIKDRTDTASKQVFATK